MMMAMRLRCESVYVIGGGDVLPAMGALSEVIVQPLMDIPAPSPIILAPTALTECSSMVPCITGKESIAGLDFGLFL